MLSTSGIWQSASGKLAVRGDMPLEEVLRMKTGEVSEMNRGTGSTIMGELLFEALIISIAEYYGSAWSSPAISDLGKMLYEEYFWMQLAELKLFEINAKKGKYNWKGHRKGPKDLDGKDTGLIEYDGKIYGELKPSTLSNWMEEFASESLRTRATIFGDKHAEPQDQQKQITAYVDPNIAKQAIADFIEQITEMKRIRMSEAAAAIESSRAARAAWTNDKEAQARAYALSQGLDYDKIKLHDFADRMAAGRDMSSLQDVQYYENNKSAIEAELRSRANP